MSTQKTTKTKRHTNREVMIVTYVFVLIFLVMISYFSYMLVKDRESYINSPYNARNTILEKKIIRGTIYDNAGNTLAITQGQGENEVRQYPYGEVYGPVIGYTGRGTGGLEAETSTILLHPTQNLIEQVVKESKEEKLRGDNIFTTLNSDLQQVAYDALGDYNGAVVVLDVATGKILAEVSKPSFDPNTISTEWDNIASGSALINRATQGKYPPGSTFKVLTALSYMRQHADWQNYYYQCNGFETVGDLTIHCFGHTVHGGEDMELSMANSCNSSFANMGLHMDAGEFASTVESFYFNKEIDTDIPILQSEFKLNKDTSLGEVMQTSFGQGHTSVTPMQMAMIAQSIANDGIMRKPYLIDRVESAAGEVVDERSPETLAQVMTAEEAGWLKRFTRTVVTSGSAYDLANRYQYSPAGKTGTAQFSEVDDEAHSWFIGFDDVNNPGIALAVICEQANTNYGEAVRVAGVIFDAYHGIY